MSECPKKLQVGWENFFGNSISVHPYIWHSHRVQGSNIAPFVKTLEERNLKVDIDTRHAFEKYTV